MARRKQNKRRKLDEVGFWRHHAANLLVTVQAREDWYITSRAGLLMVVFNFLLLLLGSCLFVQLSVISSIPRDLDVPTPRFCASFRLASPFPRLVLDRILASTPLHAPLSFASSVANGLSGGA